MTKVIDSETYIILNEIIEAKDNEIDVLFSQPDFDPENLLEFLNKNYSNNPEIADLIKLIQKKENQRRKRILKEQIKKIRHETTVRFIDSTSKRVLVFEKENYTTKFFNAHS